MNIFSGILLTIATLILIAFVSYLLWDHSKKSIDTRPEDVEKLANENGWGYSKKGNELNQLIEKNALGYMGSKATVHHTLTQKQGNQTHYIFDCHAATPISGVAIHFEGQQFLPLHVAERLIINRLNQLPADTPIEDEKLPKFVRAKVLVNSPAEYHAQICQQISESGDFQQLLKQRDLGYFCMNNDTAIFYFLTRYPAGQRGFGTVSNRAAQISLLFGE